MFHLKVMLVPLSRVNKKNVKFEWTDECTKAFNQVQTAIDNADILKHPEWNKEFFIWTDASKYAYGAVLMQKDAEGEFQPVEFMSRNFTTTEKNWHITSKELFAVIQAVKKWDHYLYKKFTVYSDSKNIEWLFKQTTNKRTNNPKHFRWINVLRTKDFEVSYIKGIDNVMADYLSRDVQYLTNPTITSGTQPIIPEKKKLFLLNKFGGGRRKYNFICAKTKANWFAPDDDPTTFSNYTEYIYFANRVHKNDHVSQLLYSRYYQRDDTDADIQKQLKQLFPLRSGKQYLNPNIERNETERKRLYKADNGRYKKCIIIKTKRNKIKIKFPRCGKIKYVDVDRLEPYNKFLVDKHWRQDLQESELENDDEDEQKQIIEDNSDGVVSSDLDEDDEIEDAEDLDIWEALKDPYFQFELLCDRTTNVDMFDRNKLIHNQKKDVLLAIVRRKILGKDHLKEWKDLPPMMKHDIKANKYEIEDDGALMYKHRNGSRLLILPATHKGAFMTSLHENIVTGNHSGVDYMTKSMIKRVYWPGYVNDIKTFVKSCRTCQLNKATQNRKHGLMKLFRATRPNELISIDHAELPETPDGNKYITSIIDNFSGLVYAEAVPRISAYNTARVIHDKWFVTKGVPQKILSDQGADFTGEIIKHLCKLAPCKKLQTTSHHPNTNGQVERWNATMKKGLRVIGTDNNLDFSIGEGWDLYIDLIVAHYNNSPSRRTGLSPNEIYFGKNIVLPFDYNLGLDEFNHNDESHVLYKQFINNCKRIKQKLARDKLNEYDVKRKEYEDRTRKAVKYKIGQSVIYLSKLKKVGSLGGLKTLWNGPYRIVASWNDGLNYTIRHIETGKRKNVAVTKLRPFYMREEYGYLSSITEQEEAYSTDTDYNMEQEETSESDMPRSISSSIFHHGDTEIDRSECTSHDDDVLREAQPILIDEDGNGLTAGDSNNDVPDISSKIVEIDEVPKLDDMPDYGSPPEPKVNLSNHDGLLLPTLDGAESIDAEPNDDHKINTNVNDPPAKPVNKISGNKRKFGDIDHDLEPPSKRKKYYLKLKKYLKKLSF